MAETTHHGGCHCGAVRYHVDLDLATPAITCNCSICARTGTMLQFVPAAKFTLEKGEEHLADYLFNKQVIHHLFCRTCGVRSFARGVGPDGSPMVAVNVRCLDNVEIDQIPTQPFDGRSR